MSEQQPGETIVFSVDEGRREYVVEDWQSWGLKEALDAENAAIEKSMAEMKRMANLAEGLESAQEEFARELDLSADAVTIKLTEAEALCDELGVLLEDSRKRLRRWDIIFHIAFATLVAMTLLSLVLLLS